MSEVTFILKGSRCIVAYSGDVNDLGTALASAVLAYKEIVEAIETASEVISYEGKTNEVGEHLIQIMLNPKKY